MARITVGHFLLLRQHAWANQLKDEKPSWPSVVEFSAHGWPALLLLGLWQGRNSTVEQSISFWGVVGETRSTGQNSLPKAGLWLDTPPTRPRLQPGPSPPRPIALVARGQPSTHSLQGHFRFKPQQYLVLFSLSCSILTINQRLGFSLSAVDYVKCGAKFQVAETCGHWLTSFLWSWPCILNLLFFSLFSFWWVSEVNMNATG